MNNIVKAMQHLNNAEKRAVKAYKTCTHAFFCLPVNEATIEAKDILLKHRWLLLKELPNNSRRTKAIDIAYQIERENVKRWFDEAKAAGLR